MKLILIGKLTLVPVAFFNGFKYTINHTTKAALLLSMLLALNYPVGLHDLCLDSTAASYFKPRYESPGAGDLSLWRSSLWYEKRRIFRTFCRLEVFSK